MAVASLDLDSIGPEAYRSNPGYIMLGMKWKADLTTIFAAFACVAAGSARIVFAHDLVLGGALIGLGIVIGVRVFIYYRKPYS